MSPEASPLRRSRSRRKHLALARGWIIPGLGAITQRRSAQDGCEDAREAMSADIDRERHPMPAKELNRHLQSCPSCREFASRAPHLHLADWVVLSKRPAPHLLDQLVVAAAESAPRRHPRVATPTARVPRRAFGPAPAWMLRLAWKLRPPWMPSRATVGTFALAGGPAVAAVCVAALGPWSSHAAIAAHLSSNGCIAPLLARHLWPGY